MLLSSSCSWRHRRYHNPLPPFSLFLSLSLLPETSYVLTICISAIDAGTAHEAAQRHKQINLIFLGNEVTIVTLTDRVVYCTTYAVFYQPFCGTRCRIRGVVLEPQSQQQNEAELDFKPIPTMRTQLINQVLTVDSTITYVREEIITISVSDNITEH